jgi:hypothetical protein
VSATSKPPSYRSAIDALVEMCKSGQGQIGANRFRAGVWNRNANSGMLPEQHKINQILARLTPEDRAALAELLQQEVQTGVFETLKVLEQFCIAPFEEGYEGSAYNDFIGRLDGWSWPKG